MYTTTLESLKLALRQEAPETETARQPLSETQYSFGFDIVESGSTAYRDFIAPQLSQVLAPLFKSRAGISVLEIGPGPKSVLGFLPGHMRRKIRSYTAFEPNGRYADRLRKWLSTGIVPEGLPLPHLEPSGEIYRAPFILHSHADDTPPDDIYLSTGGGANKYDVILFCHSMYGMRPHHRYIELALGMLDQQVDGGMVVVFHRQGTLDLAGLVCHRTASLPTGVVRVHNDNESIDRFASFIAGFTMQDAEVNEAVRVKWREACRALGRCDDKDYPGGLAFSAPEVMVAFTQHATVLAELTAHVPQVQGDVMVKNRAARLHRPAAIIRPTEAQHIQHCVKWALKYKVGLAVLGGGHSGHCLWPSVVSIDMGAFDKVHILTAEENQGDGDSESTPLVVAEAGCKTGDIIRQTMAVGLTVPLGSRPSVGTGLLHGLACDSIVGAVLISVDSGSILVVGQVPSQHQPAGAMRPENEADEADLLWAIKGAGTNFGIVVSVTFKTQAAPKYMFRNSSIALTDISDAKRKLLDFDKVFSKDLSQACSADAYLYCDAGQLHLGVTSLQSFLPELAPDLKPGSDDKIVDGVELFETEMYMSEMHGGHGGGKTSAFKRCLFLDDSKADGVAEALVKAIEARPTPLCYLHLLHGGGKVCEIAADATAFGCRDWRYACVITGVWPRDQDETEAARAAVGWVYTVAKDLLPLSTGAYGADLGPDPRDAPLATMAFGPNGRRLARIKTKFDPQNVLAYACPLPKIPTEPKVIIFVTGDSGAGKDYCAAHWASVLNNTDTTKDLRTRVVSISDEAKRSYAIACGASLDLLLHDRAYKERHRAALTAHFREQLRLYPKLREDHFLNVVLNTENVDVLFITGLREESPVEYLSQLVPASRLFNVRVEASKETRRPGYTRLTYRPSYIFINNAIGDEAVRRFAEQHLLPFFHEDLQRLADMVRLVRDFPRPGIDFRHVLGIAEQPGGLALCTSLLQSHYTGDWASVGAVVCCEAGAFVFAPALALRVNVPLALIREAGKLPPPTISGAKSSSHISASLTGDKIEIGQDVVPKGVPIVVLDDVLATGKTLYSVLQLLVDAGIDVADVTVMVLAEFPFHGGRALLHRGFGRAKIQSLLVYGGA
ncbi:phosphoribosyl transferase domain protein [Nemania sp. NC0429]|nr:phosphoribosyl transferase domain protein [Nemania sp. NC0429]